jgi:hypothetical protein
LSLLGSYQEDAIWESCAGIVSDANSDVAGKLPNDVSQGDALKIAIRALTNAAWSAHISTSVIAIVALTPVFFIQDARGFNPSLSSNSVK